MTGQVHSSSVTVTDRWIDQGKVCYEYKLHTSCCKGIYEVWKKNENDMFFLHNSDKVKPGMVKIINGAIREYERLKK